MRAHFLIGIVAVRGSGPAPIEHGEFIEDFETDSPKLVTRYCPFCGALIAGQKTNTTWTPYPPEVK